MILLTVQTRTTDPLIGVSELVQCKHWYLKAWQIENGGPCLTDALRKERGTLSLDRVRRSLAFACAMKDEFLITACRGL